MTGNMERLLGGGLSLAEIGFARPSAGWVVVILGAFVLGLTVLMYAREGMPLGRRVLACGLKWMGCGLLLLCWLEPQWVSKVPKQRANALAVLLDDSRSMRLPDAREGMTRAERLEAEWKRGAEGWRQALEREFRVRTFAVASGMREVGVSLGLRYQDSPTLLGNALKQLPGQLGERPAGVILLTDGVAPDLSQVDVSGLPPVFPVVFGKKTTGWDVGLGAVHSTLSAFEDAPVTVTAEVHVRGVDAARIRVWVERVDPPAGEGQPAMLVESQVKLSKGQSRTQVQLQFVPVQAGPTFYRVRVESPDVPLEKEVTLENNARLVCVNRARGPHRILYVSGRPNWEFGPLRRALAGDPEIQLSGLIRVAKREPKFAFKGRAGESSNPLFRGFQKGESGEVQRHDQPVLVRVNVEKPQDLAGGFPKTAEELFGYKGVILQDLEAEFFSAEQLRLLQRFVGERGGGLLMLGGMESFEGGGWRNTPVDQVLPVVLGKGETEAPGAFAWKLTREGYLEPWVRRRQTEAEEEARLKRLPVFEVLNGVSGIKPAASVMAWGMEGEVRRPALVTQRYGLGRSGALLAGDLYRWGLGDPERGADLAKFWRQTMRWLVADVPTQVEVRVRREEDWSGERVSVRVRDGQARPQEDAEVEVEVRRVGEGEGTSVRMRGEASGEAGEYTVEYPLGKGGGLVAEARVRGPEGEGMGSAQVGWIQEGGEAEFAVLEAEREAMRRLAEKTGGALLEVEQLEELPRKVRGLSQLVMETRMRPLWHSSGFFGLALACLLAEWGIRRRSGAH